MCILELVFVFGPMGVYMEVKSKTEIIFDHLLNLGAYRFNIQMIEFKQYFRGEGQRWKRGRKTSRIELIPDHLFHCLP